MTTRKHFRTLPKITYIWNGSWNDPTLIYKKHTFSYWDIEDMFYQMCRDDLAYNNRPLELSEDDEIFNLWLKENKDRCYASLDDLISFS